MMVQPLYLDPPSGAVLLFSYAYPSPTYHLGLQPYKRLPLSTVQRTTTLPIWVRCLVSSF